MKPNPDRTKFLGGSDAAAVLGISPWRTPLDLYFDKTEPKEEESTPERDRVLARGKRLEPYIIDMLRDEHGIEITERNARYIDPDHRFLSCEIDAEASDGSNIEIKTVHPFKVKDWGEQDTDQVPVHYTAQAMHGLMVTGRDRCLFAVLIGDDLRLYRVDRDVETIDAMRAKEVAFWHNHVLPRVPPPATTTSDMLRLFEKDSGAIVEATPEIIEAVATLRRLHIEATELDAEIEETERPVKLYMADAATLAYSGEVLCTWKSQTAQRFNQQAFQAAHADLFQQFKRASDSRVFRIRKPGRTT